MEYLLQYNTTDNESSASEAESNADLLPSQSRCVYLVTYSQASKTKFPSRLEFAEALIKSFDHTSAKIVQWCCSEESHQVKGTHYHAAVKLDKVQRWSSSKKYLKDRYGITVNYSGRHHNYYSAWRYVTKSDDSYTQSKGHPDLANTGEPRTNKASAKLKEGRKKRGKREQSATSRSTKKKRLAACQVSDLVLNKNIRTLTELQALAYEQKLEGKDDLAEFVIGRSQKVVCELIETSWDMKEARGEIERASKSRVDLLQEANSKECALGCNGEWRRSAGEILQSNNILVNMSSMKQ